MVSQKKINQVKALNEIINQNPNFLLIKFERTTHQNLESLRKDLKKKGAKLKVIKNTLFEKAINLNLQKEKIFQTVKKNFFPLKENSALVYFEKDWSEGLKTLFDFIKKDKTISFKFGVLDNSIYKETELEKIAQLPNRKELIAKIIGVFRSPTQRFVYSLKFNLNKFVYILKEKSKVKN